VQAQVREDILVAVVTVVPAQVVLALAAAGAVVEAQMVLALAAAAVLAFMDKGATALAAGLVPPPILPLRAILLAAVVAPPIQHVLGIQQVQGIRHMVVAVGLVVAQVASGKFSLLVNMAPAHLITALGAFLAAAAALGGKTVA
jgi:hypothetical protein